MTSYAAKESGRLRIGQLLVELKLLRAEQVDLVLQYQKEHGIRFASAVHRLGLVSAADLTNTLARQKRCAGIVIEETPYELVRAAGIPLAMLRELQVLPCKGFRRTTFFAVVDPDDQQICGALQAVSAARVQPVIALAATIRHHLDMLVQNPDVASDASTRRIEPTPAPMALPPLVRSVTETAHTVARRHESHARARTGLRDALRALQAGDFAGAVSSAKESMRSDPFDPRSTYALARGLHGLNNLPGCLTALDQTLALESEHYGAWRMRAMVCEATARIHEAVAAWEHAAQFCPDSRAAQVIRARLDRLRQSSTP